MFPIICGALTFVSTLVGGLFAVRYKKRFGILAAFAAGGSYSSVTFRSASGVLQTGYDCPGTP